MSPVSSYEWKPPGPEAPAGPESTSGSQQQLRATVGPRSSTWLLLLPRDDNEPERAAERAQLLWPQLELPPLSMESQQRDSLGLETPPPLGNTRALLGNSPLKCFHLDPGSSAPRHRISHSGFKCSNMWLFVATPIQPKAVTWLGTW